MFFALFEKEQTILLTMPNDKASLNRQGWVTGKNRDASRRAHEKFNLGKGRGRGEKKEERICGGVFVVRLFFLMNELDRIVN